jgi:regulatory protein
MKSLSPEQVKNKIEAYCAYQERCHQEVRNKLFSLGVSASSVEEIIASLITDGFLNEERFAKAFAGGKFRMKKWGKLKIVNEMERKGVSKNCIKSGLKEIDDEDYRGILSGVLADKKDKLEEENIFVLRDKLSNHAIQKGFEPELVWQILRELLPDKKINI